MSSGQPSLVHLRRIDPDRDLWRFYSLALQPTLLGGVDLIRRWGRIGTRGAGAMLVQTYPDEASAQEALERLAALKRRRGYVERPAAQGPSVSVEPAFQEGNRTTHQTSRSSQSDFFPLVPPAPQPAEPVVGSFCG